MTIFTIGYEGLTIDEFLSLLAEHDIETIVDIRELPLSRKRGFSKTALSEFLRDAGIAYVHTVELGCPKPVRDRYRLDSDWGRYTEGFMTHLREQQAAIKALCERAEDSNCALLCFEADFEFCHRSMVAEAVSKVSGAWVEHITSGELKTARPARRLAALA